MGKGKILRHRLVDEEVNDFSSVEIIAKNFAKKGRTVAIKPKFHTTLNNPEYEKVFWQLKGTKYWGKCPDLKIDDIFYEHEGFISTNPKRAFQNMLNRGLKQSSYLIIEDCGMSDRWMKHNIVGRVLKGQSINEVWIRREKELQLLYKTEAQ